MEKNMILADKFGILLMKMKAFAHRADFGPFVDFTGQEVPET